MTGSSRTTGQLTQCRTSYLPKEILWGYRFVTMVSYNNSEELYEVDYDKFDETIEVSLHNLFLHRLETFFY